MTDVSGDAAGENDVRHPAPDGLHALPNRVAAGCTGVLDPCHRHAVQPDVFGDRRPGQAELAPADAERSDHRLVYLARVDSVGDAVGGRLVGSPEQRPVALFGKRAEVRLARTHEIYVAHVSQGGPRVQKVAVALPPRSRRTSERAFRW